MFMTNQGDYYFNKVIAINKSDTTIAASCVLDSKTGYVILKFVNAGSETKTMKVDLSQFKDLDSNANIELLQSDATSENTFENATNVIPKKSDFKVNTKFDYNAPPMSLSVIRIKKIR
jgi:alpha-L-arabinofuranosidase